MEEKHFICIGCPLGCPLTVKTEGEKVLKVSGNTCGRGKIYAENEAVHPVRTLTSTVRVTGGRFPVVSVKTAADIPKEKISACMEAIKKARIMAPVHIGDIVIDNAAGTGTAVIATKNVEKSQGRD